MKGEGGQEKVGEEVGGGSKVPGKEEGFRGQEADATGELARLETFQEVDASDAARRLRADAAVQPEQAVQKLARHKRRR